MTGERAADERQSFIAEARRAQIVEAAITTLDEIGYVNASLAQIAKRARISTALISYHFKDKHDLMEHTLLTLVKSAADYVNARVRAAREPRGRLHAFIVASLAYQGTHPQRYTALIEIVFNARTADNVPYYKLAEDEEEPDLRELLQILEDGQRDGTFRPFNARVTAHAIRGAIGEYALNPSLAEKDTLEAYSAELVRLFDRVVLADPAQS